MDSKVDNVYFAQTQLESPTTSVDSLMLPEPGVFEAMESYN